jgi:RNA polymerase sigma-70 factor (ECF subfamily)
MQTAALMLVITRDGESAFDEAVRRHELQIVRIAYRILGNWADAEDVAQDVFIRLYRHGLDFADSTALQSWLYRVTVNRCIDRTRSIVPTTEISEFTAPNLSPEASLLRSELKQRLMAALQTLPAKERAAVVLREIEGLPTAEVAAILGSTEGTVRSQISKAVLRLRALLTKEPK